MSQPDAPRIAAPGFIRTADGADLFYRDWDQPGGEPVLFVGGWSLPSDAWNYQMLALHSQGLRVMAFDRRGHGRSSDPGRGYDFDTLAGDIAAVIEALDLRGVTLVGHSMGCNEIVRYLSRHGSARVRRVALLGTMTPVVQRLPDNPDGFDPALLDYFRNELLVKDFPQWLDHNTPPFLTPATSPALAGWLRQLALGTSALALRECNRAVTEADFRPELPGIAVPVLLIAGDLDVSAPLELTARRTAALLPNARLEVYHGAPHGMFVTHMGRVNGDLLEFISEPA
ncbi:arylesterase [Massilia sp. Root351]|jgi:pimeloyl-ACP methyl ester carboxylesterase|uniref:alpha/beta fold hydrolase n=1 Tax=Massilia sp. Root351 TaxID=1736522 RepID=UPI00070AA55B|nr:alpha/beta hydrolase [Massilia sp. Root351]KQV89876.1 arylesterase [Massilia sp. Root351]